MDTSGITKFLKGVFDTARKYQPEILTGLGIGGFATTVIMAVKATPKAIKRMEDVKKKHPKETDKKAYYKDVAFKVAPVYIPTAVVGSLATCCIVGASSVNYKRNAALATAYTISERALKEYQNKVVETIGEKKEEAVRAAIAKDHVDKNALVKHEVIFTGNGETTCMDGLHGRFFKSDAESIRRSVNDLNRRMLIEGYVSLNDFYDELGLAHVDAGDYVGWRIDKGYVDVSFYSILDEKNNPILVLDYKVAPYHDFDR